MLTVLESINLSTEYLAKKGIDPARTNAELLLAGILNCKRLDLYLRFDQPLKEEEVTLYREYINRRGKREPLQYIIGSVGFFGMDFDVNTSALIPRQETEILVERVLDYAEGKEIKNILDIGTGSGCIAISLAQNLPESEVLAVDVSRDALKVAWGNIKKNNIANCALKEFNIILGDINELGKFDIIVSNPPYVSTEDYKTLQKEITDFEPEIALTDFGDGYSFYQKITSVATKILNNNGALFFEAGDGMASRIENILNENSFKNVESFEDYLEIKRVVKGELF